MNDAILLTPGPLTTSQQTKTAMLKDWGSWDRDFNQLTASVCTDLTALAGGQETHVCIPLQGSGTFAVEAALGTLVPPTGKVLVPDNGAYCQRILRILGYLGRQATHLPFHENEPADPVHIEAMLIADPEITHVALVHCETGTGILNPLAEIAQAVARQGRSLIVDAMSSFGALPIDVCHTPCDALIAASGKCLEGVPGMGFVIAKKSALEESCGNSHSLALDLYDQWRYMQKTGQWRFTPPTHVVAALRSALDQYHSEGGQGSRLKRYQNHCNILLAEMTGLGLKPLLNPKVQSPIIVTFHAPDHPNYNFEAFYTRVKELGIILYPGKLTQIETFRVGCIGAFSSQIMHHAAAAIAQALVDMGVPMLSEKTGGSSMQ